ncbi:MAG TPA: Na+/H+ antiporter, partial [Gemmatimonadales bacterium]|nr:Na+/H+ antiporter [Gemmatimonadales bacterium]
EIFIILLAATFGLVALASRLRLPYPILLVLGGLALAFVPGLPPVQLAPEMVFIVFLPPILWAAAYFTSFRDFKRNLPAISLLAVGLVLVTTLAVGWVAHAIIPGIGWAAALCLGAIVSPPDAVAATAVLSRIGVPRRVIVVLEGESLVNDASALVLYRATVAAMVMGSFSLGATAGQFVVVAALGVVVGLVVGFLIRHSVRLMPEGFGQVAITLLGPYVAWVAAERLHVSAVLACVAGGIYVRQHFSSEVSPMVRLQARSVWELLIFLLNGVIFILIGLQLGPLRASLEADGIGRIVTWGLIITATATVTRLLWMPIGVRLARVQAGATNPMPPASQVFMVGWTAMRGVVSLATALALPLTTADGAPLPYRTEIILVSFVVILTTLVVQGLSLAPLARALGLSAADESIEKEQQLARRIAAEAALSHLGTLEGHPYLPAGVLDRARTHYEQRARHFDATSEMDIVCTDAWTEAQRLVRHALLDAERRAVIALRNQGEISDEVLHEVERELDVEAIRLGVGDLAAPVALTRSPS